MPKTTCDPHMFHGILWLSFHEEKKPLTTAAATRSVVGRREQSDGAAIGEADHADPGGVHERVLD